MTVGAPEIVTPVRIPAPHGQGTLGLECSALAVKAPNTSDRNLARYLGTRESQPPLLGEDFHHAIERSRSIHGRGLGPAGDFDPLDTVGVDHCEVVCTRHFDTIDERLYAGDVGESTRTSNCDRAVVVIWTLVPSNDSRDIPVDRHARVGVEHVVPVGDMDTAEPPDLAQGLLDARALEVQRDRAPQRRNAAGAGRGPGRGE